MRSLFVELSERVEVFNEGVSGIGAKKMKKNGDGIGMWRIKQMMVLNGGNFIATFGDKKETINGLDFADNRFTLILKNTSLTVYFIDIFFKEEGGQIFF